MSMERFAKWGLGKPVGFVLLTRQAAMEAEEIGTLTNWMLAGEHLEILPPPPSAKRMLEMYRDHRTVQLAVGAVLFGGDDEGWVASQFYQDSVDEQRQFARLAEPQRRELAEEWVKHPEFLEAFREAYHAWAQLPQEQVQELKAAMDGREQEGLTDKQVRQPEIQFFMRVWFPCVIAYGQWPTRLLAKARRGDLDALYKLLRIDKSILADPFIADHLHQAYASGRKGAFGKLAVAVKSSTKKMKRRQVKVRLAGLISLLARIFNTTVTAPEIQELFDAVAAAKRKNSTMVDVELPDPETFSREVRLIRAAWGILQPGKKSPAQLSG